MKTKYFECGKRPMPVFGENVNVNPFTKEDIVTSFGYLEDENVFDGLFVLKDGRLVSIHHDKNQPRRSLAYVAPSFEKIVRLGLTQSIRNRLGL